MKVTWEGKDLHAGRRIQKPDCGITGSRMVGYLSSEGGTSYGLVSMADGQFQHIGTLIEVAEHLNKYGYYVPTELCPKQWMKESS